MKLQIVVLALLVVAATQASDVAEKLREHSDACKSESGISEETLTKRRNGEEVDDPKLKEHAFCILKKSGLINEEGILQKEAIKTKFHAHMTDSAAADRLVTKCVVQKSSPQETSAHFFDCLAEARKEKKAQDN